MRVTLTLNGLNQFNCVKIPLAHQLISSTVRPNFFRISGLFTLTTPLAILSICLLLITPPAWQVLIAMSLTLQIRWSCKIIVLLLMAQGVPLFCTSRVLCFSFHIFWNLLSIRLSSTVWFIGLVYRKPQFSICGFFCSRGDSNCHCYIFNVLRSVFCLFKILNKTVICYFLGLTKQQRMIAIWAYFSIN